MTTQPLDFSVIHSFYHISPQGAEHPDLELPAADMLKSDVCRETLRFFGEAKLSHGMLYPASMIGRTMFNLCTATLYFLSMNGVFIRFRLEDITFQLEKHGDHFHLGYRIDNLSLHPLAADGEARDRDIAEGWAAFISGTAVPFIRAVAETAGCKPDMIWNQFGSGLLSVLDYVEEEIPVPHFLEQINRQSAILAGLPGELFQRRRNPFSHTPKYIENPYEPSGANYIVRSACCFNDRREGGETCYTCPLLSADKREQMRAEIAAENAANKV
jgi:ferric iron reductase protein FhuF